MGKGGIHSESIKKNINSESSTKTEVIGVDDVSPQVLWTNYFMKEQGGSHNTTICQDNKSATLLENIRRLSSGNCTKHINVQCCFIKDAIERGEVSVECLSTDKMWSDFFTKPLQGEKFIQFRKNITNS